MARVKIATVLAVIFQKYSIELAVDDSIGGDVMDEVVSMSRPQRAAAYAKAKEAAARKIKSCGIVITLKLPRGSHVPIRLVPRGREQFVDWPDS